MGDSLTEWKIVDTTETIGEQSSASVVYTGPWSERIEFMKEYYGRLQLVSGIPVYRTPAIYGDLQLYCVGASAKPFGLNTDEDGDWLNAMVTLTFGTPTEPTDESGAPADIADEKVSIGGTTINLPKTQWKWEDSDATLKEDGDVNPIKIVVEGTYSITFNQMRSLNLDVWESLIGKANDDVFGSREFAEDTILYLGAESDRKHTMDGIQNWKVTHNFGIKKSPTWQEFYRDGEWKRLISKTGSRYVYERADLSPLLTNE